MNNFSIAITFDTLEKGISLYKEKHPGTADTFTTTWLPYQLNQDAPSPGIGKREYLASRFGAQKLPAMESHLGQVGKGVGINFKFGGQTGNTLDSHRLIYLAKERAGLDTHNKVVDEIETSYFENEGDITSHAMLTAAAVTAGLDEAEVKEWLTSDAGAKEVKEEVRAAQMRGVSGVPNFVMQGKYELGGAQDAESFVGIFERIKDMEGK